jgi:hypothetical protein
MEPNLAPGTGTLVGFARAALLRAEEILARMEAGGDPHAIDKWRRVVSSLELEAAREVVAERRSP